MHGVKEPPSFGVRDVNHARTICARAFSKETPVNQVSRGEDGVLLRFVSDESGFEGPVLRREWAIEARLAGVAGRLAASTEVVAFHGPRAAR